jgi:hypothetical protein
MQTSVTANGTFAEGPEAAEDKAYWLFAVAHDRATNKGIKRNLFPGGDRNPVIQK